MPAYHQNQIEFNVNAHIPLDFKMFLLIDLEEKMSAFKSEDQINVN